MKKNLLLLILTFSVSSIFADSPITATNFYKAYLDVPMVNVALASKGKVSKTMMEYLANDTNPLDIKLAVINAVGWNHKGVNNSKTFLNYIVATKKYKSEYNKCITLEYYGTANEQLCYAYLKALDNYFNVIDAYQMALKAVSKTPNSFAINMIANLIKAQTLAAINETCYANKLFNTLKTKTSVTNDMRAEAKKYIFEYMDLLGNKCN